MSKLHWGAVAQLGCTVYSFGYGVFLFGYGLFIWVWSFHSGMVFSFGYALFIRVWSFHLCLFYGIKNLKNTCVNCGSYIAS